MEKNFRFLFRNILKGDFHMKKIVSFLLCVSMILCAISLTACDSKEKETLKLGLGVYTSAKATSATADKNGSGQATATGAAILIDAEGKIVKCFLDCADSTVSYTANGQAITTESFSTKYEQGDAYGMKAYGGAAKEWYEQANAFCEVVKGKTLNEVKALVASNNAGTDDVINAGCTIAVSEFVKAIEKAFANAKDTSATENDNLKLGVSTNLSTKDATAEKAGQSQLETTFFAAAVGTDGKITAAYSDCVQVTFNFDANGATLMDGEKTVSTKRDAGDSYGMKTYGGAAKEWYEQANAFDAACIGKTASNVNALIGDDNYGSSDLQSAGCTILVNGFVKAASKVG